MPEIQEDTRRRPLASGELAGNTAAPALWGVKGSARLPVSLSRRQLRFPSQPPSWGCPTLSPEARTEPLSVEYLANPVKKESGSGRKQETPPMPGWQFHLPVPPAGAAVPRVRVREVCGLGGRAATGS